MSDTTGVPSGTFASCIEIGERVSDRKDFAELRCPLAIGFDAKNIEARAARGSALPAVRISEGLLLCAVQTQEKEKASGHIIKILILKSTM
jgi:hypothetical protein